MLTEAKEVIKIYIIRNFMNVKIKKPHFLGVKILYEQIQKTQRQ